MHSSYDKFIKCDSGIRGETTEVAEQTNDQTVPAQNFNYQNDNCPFSDTKSPTFQCGFLVLMFWFHYVFYLYVCTPGLMPEELNSKRGRNIEVSARNDVEHM